MRSFTLSQIANILHASTSASTELPKGYNIDSRSIKPGELFFALPGQKVDGHKFLQEVKEKGALAAIVSKNCEVQFEDFPLIKVECPFRALQELASFAHAQTKTRVVAITGSLGKTTTKEFTKTLLSQKFHIAASPGNSNSQVGLPLNILNHTHGDEDVTLLEMGMTEKGQLTTLINITPPEVAVITKVALVHACNFTSLEEIACAKGEIFSHPHTKMGFFDKQIESFKQVLQIGNCLKKSFGLSEDVSYADYTVTQSHPPHIFEHSLQKKYSLADFKIRGKHNLHNLAASIAIARYFNIEWDIIESALPLLSLPEKRLQWTKKHGIHFLNDSYNAAEESVKAALELLPEPAEGGRKIAILGSMLELGAFSKECHEQIGKFALKHVEKVFCLGSECEPIIQIWKNEGKPAFLFDERAKLVDLLKTELKPKDVVLLKGSRGKELWKILEEI